MSDAARARLAKERKQLLESKPAGCFAKPLKGKDGSVDLMNWEAGITPLSGSAYLLPASSAGTYRVTFAFPADFPASPPLVKFSPPIFHTNVFTSGNVCLSLLLAEGHHPGAGHKGFWQATLTMGDLLKALQQFLDDPNPNSMCVPRRGRAARAPYLPLFHPPPPRTFAAPASPARPRSANEVACAKLKQSPEAYREQVLKSALSYPAELERAKEREARAAGK